MKTLIANRQIIVSIILVLMSFCFLTETTYSQVSISEIMYAAESRFTPPQWIELHNAGTESLSLIGWTLSIHNKNTPDLTRPENITVTITFKDSFWGDAPTLFPNETVLITSSDASHSTDLPDDQIYDLRWKTDLPFGLWDTMLSVEAFYIELIDNEGNLVDTAGNFDGSTQLWRFNLGHRGKTRDGFRSSVIRRYVNGVALDGTLKDSWVPAVDANLPKDQQTYYGDENDISSPGIFNTLSPAGNTGGTPPVVTQQTPTSDAIVRLLPATVTAPAVGAKLTFTLSIEGGTSVAGYEATLQFNETAFRYVESSNSDYLPDGAFFAPPIAAGNRVTLSAASLAGEANGDGTLATITFEVIAEDTFTLTLAKMLLSDPNGKTSVPKVENAEISKTGATGLKGDVNGDGQVNISDLVLVASNLGKTGPNAADVNGDGQVNISDLVLVASALGTTAAAPSLYPQALEMLTATEVKQWLSAAQQLNLTDPMSLKGIRFLEQLLMTLIPKETALLANFPNPFNPETWIPYHLAKDVDVTLHIYAVNGTLVRTLALGHQPAGRYQNRSRAAYWDGKNAIGEPVASGLYFYTLTAGDFTATRKMLIRK